MAWPLTSFNASAKEANDMSSIETLLRRRLLVPAPSLLPVSGLGKLAVLVSTRASRRLLLASLASLWPLLTTLGEGTA